jgi:hypothetical protein
VSNNPKPKTFSVEEARAAFRYDPETGALYWRISPNSRAPAGTQITRDDGHGYLTVGYKGKIHRVHHIVWAIIHGAWPARQIDHEDRNPANNRPNNLKEATEREQKLNRRLPNKTGYKGVARRSGNFQAKLWVEDTYTPLGTFRTAREAAIAFDIAAANIPGVLTNQELGLL